LYYHVTQFPYYEYNLSKYGDPMSFALAKALGDTVAHSKSFRPKCISLQKLLQYGSQFDEVITELLKYFFWQIEDGLNSESEVVQKISERCKKAFELALKVSSDQTLVDELCSAVKDCIYYSENAQMGQDEQTLSYLCQNLIQDNSYLLSKRAIVLATAKVYSEFIQEKGAYCDDREVILEAVKGSPGTLAFASDRLKNDTEIVMNAVRGDGAALGYASDILRRDKAVVLEALREKYFGVQALQYASYDLRNNRKVMMEAVRRNGCALSYASETLKSDRDIVMTAVAQNGAALQYASEELRGDRDIILSALDNDVEALEYVARSLKLNKEIAMYAVKRTGRALQWVPEPLRRDKDIYLEALRNYDPSYMITIPEELLSDKQVVLETIKSTGINLKDIPDQLHDDPDIIYEAIVKDPSALQHASPRILDDKEFMVRVVKYDGQLLSYASKRLQNDKDLKTLAGIQVDQCGSIATNKQQLQRKQTQLLLMRQQLQKSCNIL
jgi:hypothetical protein